MDKVRKLSNSVGNFCMASKLLLYKNGTLQLFAYTLKTYYRKVCVWGKGGNSLH
jgi:hypothetical protein